MLEGKHYQNAYICEKLEAGIDLFRGRGLRKEPLIMPIEQEVATPTGLRRQKVRICFIWIDDLQYELIEVIEDEVGIYNNCPSNGGPLRFHHICMRVDDWDGFRARVDAQDLPIAMERVLADASADQLKFLYLDGRKVFGHYLEYTYVPDAMWEHIRGM